MNFTNQRPMQQQQSSSFSPAGNATTTGFRPINRSVGRGFGAASQQQPSASTTPAAPSSDANGAESADSDAQRYYRQRRNRVANSEAEAQRLRTLRSDSPGPKKRRLEDQDATTDYSRLARGFLNTRHEERDSGALEEAPTNKRPRRALYYDFLDNEAAGDEEQGEEQGDEGCEVMDGDGVVVQATSSRRKHIGNKTGGGDVDDDVPGSRGPRGGGGGHSSRFSTSNCRKATTTTATKFDDERASQNFDIYAESGSGGAKSDVIGEKGLQKLARDLGWPDYSAGFTMWFWAVDRLTPRSERSLLSISKKQWMETMADLGVSTVRESISVLEEQLAEAYRERRPEFTGYYRLVFTYLLVSDRPFPHRSFARVLDKEIAKKALLRVVGKHSPFAASFCAFLATQNTLKAMNLDQWTSFLTFSWHIHFPSVTGYSSQEPWPVLFDDYVEWGINLAILGGAPSPSLSVSNTADGFGMGGSPTSSAGGLADTFERNLALRGGAQQQPQDTNSNCHQNDKQIPSWSAPFSAPAGGGFGYNSNTNHQLSSSSNNNNNNFLASCFPTDAETTTATDEDSSNCISPEHAGGGGEGHFTTGSSGCGLVESGLLGFGGNPQEENHQHQQQQQVNNNTPWFSRRSPQQQQPSNVSSNGGGNYHLNQALVNGWVNHSDGEGFGNINTTTASAGWGHNCNSNFGNGGGGAMMNCGMMNFGGAGEGGDNVLQEE